MPFVSFCRTVYDRILEQAGKGWARMGLYLFSFLESIIIPVPTDPLMIAAILARRELWIQISLLTALSSTLGGVCGWALGAFMQDFISDMLQLLPHQIASEEKFTAVSVQFEKWGLLIVLIGAFTPLPYKVIAISAGLFGYGLLPFIAVSIIGRSARFALVGGMTAHHKNPKIIISLLSVFLLLISAGMIIIS